MEYITPNQIDQLKYNLTSIDDGVELDEKDIKKTLKLLHLYNYTVKAQNEFWGKEFRKKYETLKTLDDTLDADYIYKLIEIINTNHLL